MDAIVDNYFIILENMGEKIEVLQESVLYITSSTLDIYLSSLSNKMNEVMKVLTIMASIFIPLTFIAGIYGMNFKLMPELEWKWGYPAVWITILVIVILMLVGFRHQKWL